MPRPAAQEITQLLLAWGRGDECALEQLMPLVYDEVRSAARRYMARHRPDHTLQPTALVNEAYLRLVNLRKVKLAGPSHLRQADAAETVERDWRLAKVWLLHELSEGKRDGP